MRTRLAWRNVLHHKLRSAAAVAGLTVPVILLFVQLGLYGAALATATIVYDALDFDLVILSRRYVAMARAGEFPRRRLHQAQAVTGVEDVRPLYVNAGLWRNPDNGEQRRILMLGFDPRKPPFHLPEVRVQESALTRPDTVLIDRLTRPEYGPQRTGVVTELRRRRMQIVGQYTLGAGLGADGAVMMSDQTFANVLGGGEHVVEVSVGLIRLATGADERVVASALRSVLPEDVAVLSRRELEEFEKAYWIQATSIGFIFSMGVAVALVVQLIIPYQILSTDITNRLAEYATLKAIGYSQRYLWWTVWQQAMILAIVSFVIGLVVSLGLYDLTVRATRLPMTMPAARVAFVLGGSVVLGSLAAGLSIRRTRSLDPAELF